MGYSKHSPYLTIIIQDLALNLATIFISRVILVSDVILMLTTHGHRTSRGQR